jgi:3-hydroxyisobutyrate dehydrogenase
MLADDAASWSVWAGSGGALERIPRGAIVVECSTVSPTWVAELTALAAAKGCAAIDAPVTGSRTQAANGELQFLVGGDAAVLERVRPVLAAMSRNIVHVGPAGSGARLKLINNYLCGVQAAGAGGGRGVDRAIEPVARGVARCAAERRTGEPAGEGRCQTGWRPRDYAVNFKLGLMTKDLSYAIAEGQRHGVDLETARAALGRFQLASQTPWNDQDFAAVVEVLRP